jgi:dipeptidase E
MKLLLTSAGISNISIRNTLVDLLGKPIEESKALFIPTAIYGITYNKKRTLGANTSKY